MKNYEVKKAILEKIKEYNRIIIFRHFRPDGDAVGSTKGLQAILKLTFPEKEIYLQNSDYCDYMKFLGPEDEPIADELYADALGIVVDTATIDRVSNKKYSLCRELVKIDHHIDIKPYGDLSWVEEERSSSCEMIVDFYDTFKDELKISPEAAKYIYTGMVTDSGRFRYRSVSGETLRLAGMLLDQGIDTDNLYANLYLDEYKAGCGANGICMPPVILDREWDDIEKMLDKARADGIEYALISNVREIERVKKDGFIMRSDSTIMDEVPVAAIASIIIVALLMIFVCDTRVDSIMPDFCVSGLEFLRNECNAFILATFD